MRTILILMVCLMPVMVFSQERKDQAASLPVKEGAAGVYVFAGINSKAATVKLYRSYSNNNSYQPLGEVKMASSEQRFRDIAGKNALKTIAAIKHLQGERAAYDYIVAHPDPKEYGLSALNIDFLRAMGYCYLDEDAKSKPFGTKIFYKAEIAAGDKTGATEGSVITGVPPVIAKPELDARDENDSLVSVKWVADATRSAEAILGFVYRKDGVDGNFEKVGIVMAQRNEKEHTLFYKYDEKVTPGHSFYYFVVPVTYTQLPGPASDTVLVLSHEFRNFPGISLSGIADTMNGLLISWDAVQKSEWYNSIIIERSKSSDNRFEIIDSVSIDNTSYLDAHVLPNTQYVYRIRLLSLRGNLSDPSATRTYIHKDRTVMPDAPQDFTASIDAKGIVTLKWTKSQRAAVTSAYKIYRTGGYDTSWRLVSNLVYNTTATDTLTELQSAEYKYAVRAVSYGSTESMRSEPAFITWNNPSFAVTPIGLRGYAGKEQCVLSWIDVKGTANDLIGYNIYRKETAENQPAMPTAASLTANGFYKINDAPLSGAAYTDTGVLPGKNYVYAVTAVNIARAEGPASATLALQTEALSLYPPVNISVRKTTGGIVVDWGKTLQDGITAYEVCRRVQEENDVTVIGKVSGQDESYTDKTAAQGKVYLYSVRSVGSGVMGERSEEKGIAP